MSEQNYSNHNKVVPGFLFLVLPVLLLNLIQSVIAWKAGHFSFSGLVAVLLAIALIRLALFARSFALGVQDRVIRLEERLRYERILPEDLRPRIGEFTINQLVSLRFASDAELPALARKVLDGNINDRRTIKQMVQNWRPDFQRV